MRVGAGCWGGGLMIVVIGRVVCGGGSGGMKSVEGKGYLVGLYSFPLHLHLHIHFTLVYPTEDIIS